MKQLDDLKTQVERQAQRMKKAEHERPTLISQTVYIGTLGLLFVLPVIGGAYLGLWLDSLAADYSSRWGSGGARRRRGSRPHRRTASGQPPASV